MDRPFQGAGVNVDVSPAYIVSVVGDQGDWVAFLEFFQFLEFFLVMSQTDDRIHSESDGSRYFGMGMGWELVALGEVNALVVVGVHVLAFINLSYDIFNRMSHDYLVVASFFTVWIYPRASVIVGCSTSLFRVLGEPERVFFSLFQRDFEICNLSADHLNSSVTLQNFCLEGLLGGIAKLGLSRCDYCIVHSAPQGVLLLDCSLVHGVDTRFYPEGKAFTVWNKFQIAILGFASYN
jgi:hypothetical protein